MRIIVLLLILISGSNLLAQTTPYGIEFKAYSQVSSKDTCQLMFIDEIRTIANNQEINRFLHVDPMAESYPGFTPYHMAMNNPIFYIDPTGMWSATYDSASNSVHVVAEKGDSFEDLYSQMGKSKDEFEKWAKENGYDLSKGPDEMAFNISEFVYAENSSANPNTNESNCHGFLLAAKGLTSSENAEYEVSTKNFIGVSNPRMGDAALYYMKGQFQYNNQINPVNADNIQGHSAVFILNNQAGEPQYLNRINTSQPITVNTQAEIVNYFSNPQNAYLGPTAYRILPKLNPNPVYYRR